MSIEKPWAKPFTVLLDEMVNYWRGEIIVPKDYSGPEALWFIDSSFYEYPRYRTRVNGYRLKVEISEFPAGDALPFDADDNVEYLRIHVTTPTSYNMLIRHERLMDKLTKILGLAIEVQTGNAEFDKRYFLTAKSDQGRATLGNAAFQQTVMDLEPFATLRISPTGICWSQEIRKKSQLELSKVRTYVEHLLSLVESVSLKT